MSRTIKLLISNWPRTREFSQLLQTGKLLLTFLTMVTRWSRSTSNFYVLIGQKLTGEFMRKIYAASWNLITIVNQWSVLAILLFAKNADNENKKCLKKSKKSRLCPGPFLCLVFLAECTRLTAVKKWREILGNCGINLQVFICSCALCSGNVPRCRIFTSKFRWTRNA